MTKKECNMQRIRKRPGKQNTQLSLDGSEGGLPLQQTLRTYVLNLLGHVEMEEQFLGLVLDALSAFGQESLFSKVFTCYTGEEAAAKAEEALRDNTRRHTDKVLSWLLRAVSCPENSMDEAQLQEELQRIMENEQQDVTTWDRLEHLKGLFQLDDADLAIVSAALCYGQAETLEDFLDAISFPLKLRVVAIMTGQPVSRIMKAAGRTGRLVTCGLLEPLDAARRRSFFTLTADVYDYLLGIGAASLLEQWCHCVRTADFSVDDFNFPARDRNIVLSLLQSDKPCHVLLYGKAGTGKTEFAKALSMACRKPAYFISYGAQGENKDRRPAIEATANTFGPRDAVIVVDEADGFLNTRYAFAGLGASADMIGKCWLNDFLETAKAQIIWISNDVVCIEESTRRRFTYSVEFKRRSQRERKQIWWKTLRGHPLQRFIGQRLVDELSRSYRVNAAGIADALRVAGQVLDPDSATPEDVVETLNAVLASHQKLVDGKVREGLAGLSHTYDPRVTHTDADTQELPRYLRHYGDIGDRKRGPANLLFWGLPGTGKTAYAKFLAQSLGVELLIKRASDLLSMFVGGTEQQIRQAFEEAERENAILLLDEADTFFINRKTAVRSWESSQTNELLTQMENHHGILICCTNLLDHLDHAAMRRFTWKIKFLPLTAEGRMRLYRQLFKIPGRRLSATLRKRLTRLEGLTAGDMQAIRQRCRPATEEGRTHETIIQALEREVDYRTGKAGQIGFSG